MTVFFECHAILRFACISLALLFATGRVIKGINCFPLLQTLKILGGRVMGVVMCNKRKMCD